MPTNLPFDPETGEIREAASNAAEFTVSEIAHALKRSIEDRFGHVRVRGEISGYRGPHSSGHCYFSLKDEGAKLDAVIWRGSFSRLRSKMQEGLEVVAIGKLTSYPGKSSYQIVIESIEPAGVGALMALLEDRRRKLAAEGLFDAARKRPLPYLPRVIGVITSPTGAVIRDILHRLRDRFPRPVLLWPVRVQGETAAAEVAAAVAGFNAMAQKPDLLIVARGGGSLEDLWPFNDEAIVRAVAASSIPVISAVGHETDTTLIDHVADWRAPTPTAAAERAVPVRDELLAAVASLKARQSRTIDRLRTERRHRLRAAANALPRPDDILAQARQRLDHAAARLPASLRLNLQRHDRVLVGVTARFTPGLVLAQLADGRRRLVDALGRSGRATRQGVGKGRDALAATARRLSLQPLRNAIAEHRAWTGDLRRRSAVAAGLSLTRAKDKLAGEGKVMASLSYRSVLARGYAVVRDGRGRVLAKGADVKPGARLDIEFADGTVPAIADRNPGQGSLF